MSCLKFCLGILVVAFVGLVNVDATNADLVYTIEGIANEFPDPSLSPQVGIGESYVAEFRIDDSALDVDADPDRGDYVGAIIASSITFSGGYTSTVEYAGGDLLILRDSGGLGGVTFSPSVGSGTILFAGTAPFATDAILDETTPVLSGPSTLWSLTEPDGLVTSLSILAAPTLTITAIPEPSMLGVLAFGCLALVKRRR